MDLDKHFLQKAWPKASFQVFDKSKNLNLDNFFKIKKINGGAIDSRNVKNGDIFFALNGKKVDAHNFLDQALKNGAQVLVLDKNKKDFLQKIPQNLLDQKLVVFVEDTLDALTNLAKNWRKRFSYPIVGITGSVGKTTTKQMLANIFKESNVEYLASAKNQNTEIGASLNILKMRETHKVAIFEMGIDAVGEMSVLADIVCPTIGVITNISYAHAHGLGSLYAIAEQKRDIFKFFGESNIGVICGDCPLLDNFYYKHPVVKFGLKTKNRIQARQVKVFQKSDLDFETNFVLKVFGKKQNVKINGNHKGLLNNALASTTVASLLDVDLANIAKGIEGYSGFENRFEKIKIKDDVGFVISDCYNANPESMKAALQAFDQMKTYGPKVAVLGDMLELGQKEIFLHKQIGRFLKKVKDLDMLILVGKLAPFIAKTAPINLKTYCCKDWKKALLKLNDIFDRKNDKKQLILVKGSRGMNLDKLVNELTC